MAQFSVHTYAEDFKVTNKRFKSKSLVLPVSLCGCVNWTLSNDFKMS